MRQVKGYWGADQMKAFCLVLLLSTAALAQEDDDEYPYTERDLHPGIALGEKLQRWDQENKQHMQVFEEHWAQEHQQALEQDATDEGNHDSMMEMVVPKVPPMPDSRSPLQEPYQQHNYGITNKRYDSPPEMGRKQSHQAGTVYNPHLYEQTPQTTIDPALRYPYKLVPYNHNDYFEKNWK
jgi:hypothetical protein